MLKAVFMDYTGTIVQENGRDIKEVVKRVCMGSNLHDPQSVLALWWKLLKQYEEKSYRETYLTEDEIVDRLLSDLAEQIGLKEDFVSLHELIQGFWIHAPLFDDAKAFFEACPLPIYVITNNGKQYVGKGLEEKGVFPADIVCADMVQAYKPHRELFEKALEVSRCTPDQVIHVGDSYGSDVQGALAAGIRPILIDRSGKKENGEVTVVEDLSQVLELLK